MLKNLKSSYIYLPTPQNLSTKSAHEAQLNRPEPDEDNYEEDEE